MHKVCSCAVNACEIGSIPIVGANLGALMTDTPVRTESGQIAKGSPSLNPLGRPLGRKTQITELKQELELAVRKHVDPYKIKKIVEKIANKAANGNVPAAKLIFDHFLSKASDTEDASDNSGRITVVVENATFAVTPKPTNVAIEATIVKE
jgi:hypothetical protein